MRKVKHPKIAVAAALVLVLLAGGLAALLLGGDDEEATTATTATQARERTSTAKRMPRRRRANPAPIITRSGTLEVARSEGRLAVAQARGLIKNPSAIRVRVSAAPKQTVRVHWQLSCYRATRKKGTTKVGVGTYRTVPLDTRSLPLPMSAADECTAAVAAQLSRTVGKGRVKVTVLAG